MKTLFNPIFTVLVCITSLALFGLMMYNQTVVQKKNPCEYQFIVTDDSVSVFDGKRTVGTIKLEGQLDSLITLDNQ